MSPAESKSEFEPLSNSAGSRHTILRRHESGLLNTGISTKVMKKGDINKLGGR